MLQRELGREDAGVLRLVFLQDVGLHRAAHASRERPPGCAPLVRRRLASMLVAEISELLVDRGVEEHGEYRRRGAVDGHRDRRRRVAEVETRVKHLHVFERRDRTPELPIFP